MGRPPKFSADQILDTAEALVAESGLQSATVTAVIERLGAPSGSIYHRFATRDLLLAHLWIRAAKDAQTGFIYALADGRPEAGVDAALHIVRWSRANPGRARVLAAHRREDLAANWPDELGPELATINDDLNATLRDYTRTVHGRITKSNLEATMFAVIDIPHAAVRRHLLDGTPPPRVLDDLVERAVTQILRLDEHRTSA